MHDVPASDTCGRRLSDRKRWYMKVSPHVLWTLLRKPAWLDAWMRTSADWNHDIADRRDLNNGLARHDDGVHPCESPFYFEWWYFDVSLSDDSALTFIFHLTDLIKPASPTGSLSVSFFRPGQPPWYMFIPYPRQAITASTQECDVRMGKNRCWIDPDGTYHVLVDEPGVKAEIAFESLMPGWQPGDGKIRFGSPQRFFSWVVPQPRAKAVGWVQLGNERWQVEGVGYHDHNWGTVSLVETLNAWSWGRVYLDDYTLVFADMRLSPCYAPARPMPLMLAYQDEIIFSAFLDKCAPIDPQRDFITIPERNLPPAGWRLTWQGAEGQFDLTLKTRHILERTDLLQNRRPLVKDLISRLVAHPYYLRCVTDAEGQFMLRQSGRSSEGRAICEQMVLRTPRQV